MANKKTLRHSFAALFKADDTLDWSSAALTDLARSDVIFVSDHDTDQSFIVVGRSLFFWLVGKDLPEPDMACIDLDFDTDEFERLVVVLNTLGKICHLRTRDDIRAEIAEVKATSEYLRKRGLDVPRLGDGTQPEGS